jgi:hypothetical protein
VSAGLVLILAVAGLTVTSVRIGHEQEQTKDALKREQQIAYFRRVARAHREVERNLAAELDQSSHLLSKGLLSPQSSPSQGGPATRFWRVYSLQLKTALPDMLQEASHPFATFVALLTQCAD